MRYSNNITLRDIFTDKKLRGKLPFISYRESESDDGKLSQRTRTRSLSQIVYDKSVASARPFYKPIKASKQGDYIVISGQCQTDLGTVMDAVYGGLLGIKQMLVIGANDTDIIRSALKESEKKAYKGGKGTPLYLREQSLQEIETMSNRRRNMLMNDIMKNIYFGDFPQTQKKFGLDKMFLRGKSYEQRKAEWEKEISE